MKHIFVIDENVTIAALTYERDTGEPDRTPAVLIETMFVNCHRFALSTLTFARWSAKVQQMRALRKAQNAALPPMMAQAMAMAGKCPLPRGGSPPELPEELGPAWTTKLDDDRDFIRLAAHFGVCFLVTYDVPLKRDIVALKLDVIYGFQVVTPDEALPFASQPSI